MTYVSKKEKVFDLPEQDETSSSVSLAKTETRLKRFPSVSDRRAWTSEENQRYQHLYGLVNGSESNISKSSSFKYIPFDVLLAILMAEKDAYIQELLERQDDQASSVERANVLYKSDGFDDSDDDRDALIRKDAEVVSLKNKIAGLKSELEDYRETLTKAMHKLESMDAVLSENNLLKEKIKYSEETIRFLEATKAQLEQELRHYKNTYDPPGNPPEKQKYAESIRQMDGGDCDQPIRLSSDRDILIRQVQELQQKLEEAKCNEAEIEILRKISETTSSSLDEMHKENELYKKKLESMKCLEKQIEELKKQAQSLTDKYKRESQKSNDQLKQINMNAKEIQLLRDERDKLQARVSELASYQSQYLSLQEKLHHVEIIIDENEILNKKLIQLDHLEVENAQLKMRLEYLKTAEIQALEDKEKVRFLQSTAFDKEEEIKKMMKHIENLSEGYTDKNEVRRLRNELEEKNGKLKKYEKQLNDIPVLESEIDMLKNKLQKCIDDFKADKDLLGKLQEELDACRKRCHELEEMAPLYHSEVPSAKVEKEVDVAVGGESNEETVKSDTDCTEIGINTINIPTKETESQGHVPELEDKSTLIMDDALTKFKSIEEQNELLRNQVASLTSKLSEIDLSEFITQTNELKNVLVAKDRKIVEMELELSSIRNEIKRYETLKLSLEEEIDLLKERGGFMKQELELKHIYIKELQDSLDMERKGREFAKEMVKTLEERVEEERSKREAGEAVLKLQKEEANFAKQEIYQYFGKEVDHLKGLIHMSKKLNRELETENKMIRDAKEYFEKTENRALKNLIVRLRAEVRVLKTLSKPELERECEALQKQVNNLLKETDNLIEEIKELKTVLDSEKSIKEFLEKEVINLQAELTACVSSGNEVFNREMSQREALISELRGKLENVEKNFTYESQELRNNNTKLMNDVNNLESEHKELKNEINQLRSREDELNKSIKDLQEKSHKELEEKTEECQEIAKKLEEACGSVENLKKELSVEKESIKTLQERIKELEEAVATTEESLKTREDEPKTKEVSLESKDEATENILRDRQTELEEKLKEKEREIEEKLKEKEKEMEEKLKGMEEKLKEMEEELQSAKKTSLDATNELNKLTSEMEVLKSRLSEKDGEAVTDIQSYQKDIEEKYALEEALRKIENELDELKRKLEECGKMEEDMVNLGIKRDSLLEKMSNFENEIESLKIKLLDFDSLKNELIQLKSEKAVISEDLEVSKLYQEVLEQKSQITNLLRDNNSLREELNKSEALLQVYKNLEDKIPENPGPPTMEFFTPPTLLTPRSTDPQELVPEMILVEVHKKIISDIELLNEQKILHLKAAHAEKLRKLTEQHEKESKCRAKAFNDSINSIRTSYESDIKKLVERHKVSIMRLQGLHEDEVQELNTTYETQMEAMQTQNENLINDLRTESAEKAKQLREQHNREMREIARRYEEMLKEQNVPLDFVRRSNEDQNEAQQVNKQAVEDMNQFYQNSIVELEEKHNQEIKKCKKNNLKRIELMKNKYEALLVEERKKYEEQLEELLLQLRNGQDGDNVRGKTEQNVKKRNNSSHPHLDFHEVLQKILNEGLECLSFEELIMVHAKTCFMPENIPEDNTGGGEFSRKIGRGCKHRMLMAAEKEELLKRIFTLEHDIVIKQLETHEAIVNMEAAERCRVQELKNALSTAQQKNAELKRLLSDQSKQEMNLKIDRYMSDKQATFHETNIVEKVKELEKEKAEKKRLEEELQRERMNVKNMSAAFEAEKERHLLHRKRDAEYVESIRKRLQEALNHEQMMEAQLDSEIKLRARLEAELKSHQGSFNHKSDMPLIPLKIEMKSEKNLKNHDRNEVKKEVKHSRSKSKQRTRLKSVNN